MFSRKLLGGLRGAVGICLALEVFRNKKLCIYKKIGPKVHYYEPDKLIQKAT